MKNRLHDKKAGIAILVSLIIISVAEVIFRAVVIKEAVLTTSNLGESLAVIILATTILIFTVKGKDRASYLCLGAWIAYFVLDQLFELFGVVIPGIAGLMAGEGNFLLVLGWGFRIFSMIGIISIGILLGEYMCDGTIYNRAFNILSVVTSLLLLGNIIIPTFGAIHIGEYISLLDTFNNLYRLTMVFLFTFFAYDSAKKQLNKVDFSK